MQLSLLDAVVFVGYFLGVVIFGVTVAARSKTKSAADYFLASKKLPWYTVGASLIASNISTEHFIGMVGWAFLYGMAVANWEWAVFITFSLLIWIFLPFYMRGNVSTMPEFLERRYNKTCRYIYAVISIVGMVIAMLGGVFYAGGKALNTLFPEMSIMMSVFMLAAAAGIYTIYGGLLSAVWADLLQYCLLMVGGTVVTLYGLYYVGGIGELVDQLPEKFIMFYPPTHETIPWTGVAAGLFSVGVWYSCANQFMVQRCLGARSEWDARMGVVMAGFSKAFLPLIIVVPGIVAFHLFSGQLSDGDQAWPFMVKQFLPAGLCGLVMAGLASAIMSTLSAMTNSSATIFTLDLYQPIFRPKASDSELRLVGRLSGAAAMLVGVVIALILAARPSVSVFGLIQTVFFYVAAPIAAVFTFGILWRRATPLAGTLTLVLGFAFIPIVRFVLFKDIPWLIPYDTFTHHTFVVFIFSIIVLITVSLLSKPKPAEELKGVIWTTSAFSLPKHEAALHRGFSNLTFWWVMMVSLIVVLYWITHSQGRNTRWFEAEDIPFTSSTDAEVRIQNRNEIEDFNLWTGAEQVLFEPTADGDWLAFHLPVDRAGRYRIEAVVTRGPGYGDFGAHVNEVPAIIRYPVLKTSSEGRRFAVKEVESTLFEPSLNRLEESSHTEAISTPGSHVVQRIKLGEFDIEKGTTRISLVAQNVTAKRSLIGVDQWMISRIE